jgi:hypothetical protein
MQRADELSQLVIGAAIEVHRIKGPGLIEEIYSKCLGRECDLRNIPCVREIAGFSGIQRLHLRAIVAPRPFNRRSLDRGIEGRRKSTADP